MPESIDAVIASCMERAERANEAHARRAGTTLDEALAADECRRLSERRAEALELAGVSLPAQDLRRIADDALEPTEALGIVRRWFASTRVDRPILVLCGAIGTGKSVAAAWAIAERGGGTTIHAPELARRVMPGRVELQLPDFSPVNLRNSLLVLDDLGTEPNCQDPRWAEAFAVFVERRMRHGRTIITTNLERGNFDRYGARIVSRFNAHAYALDVKRRESLRAVGGGFEAAAGSVA